ncbi:sensor histidine kinase [Planctomycetes bacterium K23_9]|uniref:histidine kinase n=1 Tax=Stieleria marina TaxID=1930275 RepID=A0A517NXQ7_9BACT|nr:Sporulation kinase E [Planctomycetes bacterium K23_9]
MKLAAKLILIFMLGVLGIVALFSWQTIRRQQDHDQARRAEHADDVVGAITPAINNAFRDGGVVTIEEAVEFSAQYVPGRRLRWVNGIQTREAPRLTTRKVSRISVSDEDGGHVAHTFVPVVIDGSDAGGVEVTESLVSHDSFIRGSLVASLCSLLGVAMLSGLVIYFGGVQLVGKPLEKLIDQVHEIGDGKLSQPPVLTSNDELGSLAMAISQMSGRIEQQQNTIRHTDRLGTVGTLAAGMAHEMGTPLNVVAGRANLIASGKLSPEEVGQSAKTIKSEAERMTMIIRQLLDFARQSTSEHTTIDIKDVARNTCELMETLAEKSSCKISLQMDDAPCQIKGDATQIQQVLTNLITNAIQAMPDGGNIMVAVERDQSQVCVQVTDEGVGIEPTEAKRVFEPFYTTKDVGQGTGLGLSIAYGIVKEHGGEIKIHSRPGQSTTFSVQLPSLAAG